MSATGPSVNDYLHAAGLRAVWTPTDHGTYVEVTWDRLGLRMVMAVPGRMQDYSSAEDLARAVVHAVARQLARAQTEILGLRFMTEAEPQVIQVGPP